MTTSAAWVSGGRRWGVRHVTVGGLTIAALATAVFEVTGFDGRVERRIAREQDAAAMYWAALATAGVDTDSATQLVLTQLREQFAGTRQHFDNAPFVATPNIEDVWRANGLNPFRDAQRATPRTDAELDGLRASQVDARLVMNGARAWAERPERARRQRRIAIALLVALCGVVWMARQRRPRVMLGAVALDG